MSSLINFSNGKAVMVNNGDWLLNLNYVEFLREVGVHFSVNRMLAAECYKQRLENGLSFFELNYMLMQSYDFYVLYKKYNCTMELGGDDQWSNIIGGVELVRKKEQKEVYGMTFTLLTTSEGKKMGKTEKGAVWLDPQKTTPYEFYQYWRNVADGDVIKCLKLLTFVPIDEIEQMEALSGSELNAVKERLAFEVTAVIHGKTEAEKAQQAAKALFGTGASDENMPSTVLSEADLTDGTINLLELLVITKLAPSKSEARRLVEQGGVAVNDAKAVLTELEIGANVIKQGVIIKKGKKAFHKVTF
jgi:tyrosyl-tRNA synthetase